MKINSDRVKKYRAEKNWSQEKLSEASGLSLRTIQRLENTGKASIESVRALAAAFNIDSNELILIEKDESPTPLAAIKTCFIKFADFSGTATRFECWWFVLFVLLIGTALAYLSEAFSSAFLVLMLLPMAAVGTRRLHDTGKSGWWQLYVLVPVAGIFLLLMLWAMPPTKQLGDPLPG